MGEYALSAEQEGYAKAFGSVEELEDALVASAAAARIAAGGGDGLPVCGVVRGKSGGGWQAYVTLKRVNHKLLVFSEKQEAGACHDAAVALVRRFLLYSGCVWGCWLWLWWWWWMQGGGCRVVDTFMLLSHPPPFLNPTPPPPNPFTAATRARWRPPTGPCTSGRRAAARCWRHSCRGWTAAPPSGASRWCSA